MRRISVTLTEQQIASQSKRVTRRDGWERLRVGDRLQPVRKAMGLRKGEKQVCIGPPIVITAVRREQLRRMLVDPDYGRNECAMEGFPDMTPDQFVAMFCSSHKGCTAETMLTRIEFDYERAALSDH
jgi:hypothetical protein